MRDVLLFALIGFIAQLVNGSLGMAYGMITMTFMLAVGTPPLVANSSVQFAKLLTSGVSSVSHWRLGNVNRPLLWRLALFGMAGGVLGALVAIMLPTALLTPLVAVYLFIMGVRIFLRLRTSQAGNLQEQPVHVMPLGAIAGFLNAVGGAGWGPITTSTLLAKGKNPRQTIGSVSVAEFFVSVATFVTLVSRIPLSSLRWQVVVGLMLGGVIAAPLAAYVCGRLPTRTMMVAVSMLIMVLSVSIFMSVF